MPHNSRAHYLPTRLGNFGQPAQGLDPAGKGRLITHNPTWRDTTRKSDARPTLEVELGTSLLCREACHVKDRE